MNSTTQQFSRHVSVKSKEGIRVEVTVTINRPIADVFSFWRRFENFPLFMRHVEEVRVEGLQSHWKVKGLGNKILEWDAEIIEEQENALISWRSLPGADVDNAGSVWFTPALGGRGTAVKVLLKYQPPGGKVAAFISKLFGKDAESEIKEDLFRVKSLLETGEIPTIEGQAHLLKGDRR